jgi:WhiB family redox-sensing transcriptional regulator
MSRQQSNRPTDDDSWELRSACRGIEPAESEAVFFPLSENRKTATIAGRMFCDRCPVRAECLSTALYRREPAGIWAGVTTLVRDRMRRNRTRLKCPVCRCTDLAVISDQTPTGVEIHQSVCVACGASWRMEPGVVYLRPTSNDPDVLELIRADEEAAELASVVALLGADDLVALDEVA